MLTINVMCKKDIINNYVRWFGRTYYDTKSEVFWFNHTCSGFEFSFTGTHAECEIMACLYESERFRPYVAIFLDGEKNPEKAKIIPLNRKLNYIELADGLENGIHRVKVVKITEQTTDNIGSSRCGLISLNVDGEFLNFKRETDRKIEFYGDSITCGYGITAGCDTEFSTKTENGLLSYAALTSVLLNAEANYVCASGWPLVKNLYNDVYLLKKIDKIDFSNDDKWDFSLFTPGVVALNIGTNDSPYIMSLKGNEAETARKNYLAAYKSLVKTIHRLYPEADIVALWGMMCKENEPANDSSWLKIFRELKIEGVKIYPLRLSGLTQYPEHVKMGHPDLFIHKKAALDLAKFISLLKGWEIDAEFEKSFCNGY